MNPYNFHSVFTHKQIAGSLWATILTTLTLHAAMILDQNQLHSNILAALLFNFSISNYLLYLKGYLLSQGLDDLGTTRGECLGRTRWSSLLDWTIYLYYFYKWLYTTSPQSHVLLECSTVTWACHMIWLLKFPCYLYLVFIVWLDSCDQVFERMENLFLLRALITMLVER